MRKVIISLLMVIVMIGAMIGTSYAAQLTATIEIKPSVTEVSAGDKVTFSFVIKNVTNALNDSIGAIEGKVEYDTNFFELDSDTTLSTGGESGENFNVLKDTKEGATIAKLVLKVKDKPTGSGVVKFTNLSASDGDTSKEENEAIAKTADQEFTIKLKTNTSTDPDTEEPENPSTPNNPSNPSNSSDQTDTDKSTETPGETPTKQNGNDSTIANKSYDKAGISIMLLIAIIISLIVAIVMYKKNQKFRDIK